MTHTPHADQMRETLGFLTEEEHQARRLIRTINKALDEAGPEEREVTFTVTHEQDALGYPLARKHFELCGYHLFITHNPKYHELYTLHVAWNIKPPEIDATHDFLNPPKFTSVHGLLALACIAAAVSLISWLSQVFR